MPYTLGQAARAAGKGKATIKRALDVGRISGRRNEAGEWQIEPVELHRVFPAVPRNVPEQGPSRSPSGTADGERVAALEAEKAALERSLEREQDTVRDLRARLDASEQERREASRQLWALLEDRRPVVEPEEEAWSEPDDLPQPPGFWRRLFGGWG